VMNKTPLRVQIPSMKKKTAARERAGSDNSDDVGSIIEETSSELKFFTSVLKPAMNQKPPMNQRASFTGRSRSRSMRGSNMRSQSMRNPSMINESLRNRSIRNRKAGKEAKDGDTTHARDLTRKNSNRTGDNNTNNEDESSTSPLTNTGEGNENRNSDTPVNDTGPEDRRAEMIRNFRQKCGVWVNNDRVQITMVTFILINAIMMGLATFAFIRENAVWEQTFEICDQVFLTIFTIELLMQFIYHGFYLLTDGWLCFDLIIISISWGLNQLQIVRVFRIFRAFRLITRVKIMKDLILALFSVMPRMAAIFLMLLLIFYIFAVMFTQLYEDNDDEFVVDHFGMLSSSLITLFQMMTMDEWADVLRNLSLNTEKESVTKVVPWFFMITFVIISGFIVVNLIVAVICDAIGALDEKEKAKFHGHHTAEDESTNNVELRDQLDTIEDQIGDLTRIQARTFHTLEYLTQQLRVQKEKTRDDANSMASKSMSTSADDTTEEEQKKDRRASMLKKERSGERSRRKNFATMGFDSSKRITYTDTWTQEGEEKDLRRAMISNFAKSARELQKMREEEETI